MTWYLEYDENHIPDRYLLPVFISFVELFLVLTFSFVFLDTLSKAGIGLFW